MKKSAFNLACVAMIAIAGCSREAGQIDQKAETGRGTFVSAEGEAVTAVYFKPGQQGGPATVELRFPGKPRLELYAAMSGSGTRYTNGTAEWWEHQGEAVYGIGGTNVFRGKIVSPK